MSARNIIQHCLMGSLIVLLASLGAGAQEKLPIEFTGITEPVILTPGGETRIQVLNKTTAPLTLKLAIVDDVVVGKQPLSTFTSLAESDLKLARSGSGAVVLRTQCAEALKPGMTLTATLVVSDNSSGTLKQTAIKLALARPPAPLISATAAMKSQVYQWPWPFSNKKHTLNVPLPLNSKVSPEELAARLKTNQSLGLLINERGQTAGANYQAVTDYLPGGTTGIVLGLESSGAPGTYAGQLSGVRTHDDQPVTLTVIMADAWLSPALVCFAGILAYYIMQRYLNVGRKVRELQEQEAALGVDFALAAERFARTADGRRYTKDTIQTDFDNQRSLLLKRIDGLRLKNFLKLDENSDAYKEVVKQLGELGEATQSWSAFAEQKLNVLDDALTSASSSFNLRPPDASLAQQAEPALASEAVDVLAPRSAPMTIAEFKMRAARVGELLPLLTSWERLNGWAAKTWQRYEEIVEAPGFSKQDSQRQEKIKSEQDSAFTIWRKVWVRESFDLAGLQAELFKLQDSLAILAAENAPSVSADFQPAGEESIDEHPSPGVSPEKRVLSLAARRFGWDVFYLALVTAVAVYSGLTELYFDKPFGTGRDYLKILVWGFGTKLVIDAVTGAINRFRPATVR